MIYLKSVPYAHAMAALVPVCTQHTSVLQLNISQLLCNYFYRLHPRVLNLSMSMKWICGVLIIFTYIYFISQMKPLSTARKASSQDFR
jgi:hypothetical protein